MRTLHQAGVPVGVLVAPIIPQLNDRHMESILEAAAQAGATTAGWIMLRLPLEIAPLFRAWLDEHFPLRAAHIMSLVQQVRGGRDYVSAYGERMRGTGVFADLIEKRFDLACKRLGLNEHRDQSFDTTRFKPPRANDRQRELF
jgi:DNA repair photolyase